MTPPTEIRHRAKNLVDQLPGESLAEAVTSVSGLDATARGLSLSRSELVERIGRRGVIPIQVDAAGCGGGMS